MAGSAFNLYDVTVRLNGDRNNEVRRFGVTAPEIQVLGAIHGPDSIANVVDTKKKDFRADKDERMRLAEFYERASPIRRGFIRRLFGPSTLPLSRKLDKDFQPEEQINPDTPPDALREEMDSSAAQMALA